jgi:8-oxo-dGTP pyrophosphatase MutT (NUDIX family)
MITFEKDNARFNYRIAGVAIHNGRVLLNGAIEEDFWFLPGGRAEMTEPAQETLRREMREELGTNVEVERLLWVVENFFEFNGRSFHELGLYFLMSFPADSPLYNREGSFAGLEELVDLKYQWFRLDELSQVRLHPAFLKEALQALPATTQHIVHKDTDL